MTDYGDSLWEEIDEQEFLRLKETLPDPAVIRKSDLEMIIGKSCSLAVAIKDDSKTYYFIHGGIALD